MRFQHITQTILTNLNLHLEVSYITWSHKDFVASRGNDSNKKTKSGFIYFHSLIPSIRLIPFHHDTHRCFVATLIGKIKAVFSE